MNYRDKILFDVISYIKNDNFDITTFTDEELTIFLEECRRKNLMILTVNGVIIPSQEIRIQMKVSMVRMGLIGIFQNNGFALKIENYSIEITECGEEWYLDYIESKKLEKEFMKQPRIKIDKSIHDSNNTNIQVKGDSNSLSVGANSPATSTLTIDKSKKWYSFTIKKLVIGLTIAISVIIKLLFF